MSNTRIFKEYKNEEEFLKENEYELLLSEEINNTMLSIIPQIEKKKIFFRIENNEKIELIGIVTKTDRKGLIAYIRDLNTPIDVYEFLVNEIIERNIELKEVKAPKGIAEIISDLYSKKKSVSIKSNKTYYLLKLNNLIKPSDRDEIVRKATIDDLEFEKEMVLNIHDETLKEECSEKKAYEVAKVYIQNGLYFLTNKEGEILTQVCTTKIFKNGYTLGAVYTPKEKRKNGYAKICLYKVIKGIIENKDKIVLYVNIAKQQNRKLYESLGFEIIFEESEIRF